MRERRLDNGGRVNEAIPKISAREVRSAMKRMKSRKAVGPDDIPVKAWRCLSEVGVVFLTRLFNNILEGEKMA